MRLDVGLQWPKHVVSCKTLAQRCQRDALVPLICSYFPHERNVYVNVVQIAGIYNYRHLIVTPRRSDFVLLPGDETLT